MKDIETITVSEFKATCLRLIEVIKRSGRKMIVTKNGEPAVMISPVPQSYLRQKSYCGIAKDRIKITGDIITPLDVEWDVLKK